MALTRPSLLWLAVASALLPIAILAAVHIPHPLAGDQAMFVYGARELTEGATLYVDFWDMKQPGIYWFCAIAGSLFGFDEIGIHIAEAIWLLALGALLVAWLLRILDRSLVVIIGPLLCLGPFYAATQHYYLTMVELLINLPLLAFAACLYWPPCRTGVLEIDDARNKIVARHVVAGLMVTVVALFKLMLVLIPLAMLAAAIAISRGEAGSSWRVIVRTRILPLIAAAAASGLGIAAYLWWQGSLDEAMWTTFVYPARALDAYPDAPVERIVTAFRWLFERHGVLLMAAVPGLFLSLRPAAKHAVWIMIAWALAGTVAIGLQSLSWWIYHTTVLIVPLGVLAVIGFENLIRWALASHSRRWVLPAVSVAMLGALLVGVARPLYYGVAVPLWQRAPWTATSLREYQARIEPKVAALQHSAAFLDAADSRPGRIALLGDPRVLLYSQRRPVRQINGWTYYLPSQLEAVARTLDCEAPPYVYASRFVAHLWTNGTDAVQRILDTSYEVLVADDGVEGTWYLRVTGPRCN